MASDSRKEKEPNTPRILARQLARPLTEEELDRVNGGLRPANGVAGAVRLSADTWCETGSPCSNDCGT